MNRLRILASCAFVMACSSGTQSAPIGGRSSGSGGASNGSSLAGAISSGSSTGGPGAGGFGLGDAAACAGAIAMARLTPVNLVIMYDKSGSMGDATSNPPFDPNLKWNPCNAGMKAFFADPGSQGLSASLAFFPADGDLATACAGPYDVPKVPMTPLTNGASFVTALDMTKPYGGTPTLPALEGAIQYAKQVWQRQPDSLSVVVLVTDGEPGFAVDTQIVSGCLNNDIPHVAAAAQAALAGTPSIKTYVIGIGAALDKLDMIAAAGGTGRAMMIAVSDPAQTKAQMQAAFSSIRSISVPCNLAIPAPPTGSTLDIGAVNVIYTGGGGEKIIGSNPGCAQGVGWQYDLPKAPTRIELCPSTCAEVQGDTGGKLAVMFGCNTIIVPK